MENGQEGGSLPWDVFVALFTEEKPEVQRS